MKVGIIVDNGFFEDIRVTNEANILLQAGYELFILCLHSEKARQNPDFPTASIVTIKMSKFIKDKLRFISNSFLDIYSFIWAFYIRRFLKKYQIEYIHTHDLYMARAIVLANRYLNKKTIIDLHENYPYAVESYGWSKKFPGKIFVSKNRWLKREHKYLPSFDRIIVLSQFFKEELMRRVPINDKRKIFVIPNYPDIKQLLNYELDRQIIEEENRYGVFYFGVVSERRGIYTLIDALKILVNKGKDIRVLIIGPVDKSDRNKFYSIINEPFFKDRIRHYKWKDISLLPSYLYVSDMTISPLVKNPQHESGIANKIFQYLLFGKPVIVSDCKPQADLIKKENAGLVFNSQSAEDLADKISQLLEDRNLMEKMGLNGKNAVLEKYNTEITGNELLEAYRF